MPKFFEKGCAVMNFIKKYLRRRKMYALIDAKIKSPFVRELLKTSFDKNL